MKKQILLYAVIASLALVGCAKDKDSDDYQAEQAQKDLAKLQSVEGPYTGLLISAKTGKPMAAMALSLKAVQQGSVSTGTNGGTTSGGSSLSGGTPTLQVTLNLETNTVITIPMTSTSYSPTTQIFSSQLVVSVTQATGGSANGNGTNIMTHMLLIQGTIRGSSISGVFEDPSYPDNRATFTLSRGGADIQSLSTQAHVDTDSDLLSAQSRAEAIRTYWGEKTEFGQTSIVVTYPPQDQLGTLLDVFSRNVERVMNASLGVGSGVFIGFSSLLYDSGSKTLAGSQSYQGNGFSSVLLVSCKNFNFDAATDYDFTCIESGGPMGVQQFHFSSKLAPPPATQTGSH